MHDFGNFSGHLGSRILETRNKTSLVQKDESTQLGCLEEKAALETKKRAFQRACSAFSSVYRIRKSTIARLHRSSADTSDETKALSLMLRSYESVLRLNGNEQAANRVSREASEISENGPFTFFGALEEGRGQFSLESFYMCDSAQVAQPFELQRGSAYGMWR